MTSGSSRVTPQPQLPGSKVLPQAMRGPGLYVQGLTEASQPQHKVMPLFPFYRRREVLCPGKWQSRDFTQMSSSKGSLGSAGSGGGEREAGEVAGGPVPEQ